VLAAGVDDEEQMDANGGDETDVIALYDRLLEAWNRASADEFAAAFAAVGTVVGFDGSEHVGRDAIGAALGRIFADHTTATYVGKVRSVRPVGPEAALFRAVAGMIPPGGSARRVGPRRGTGRRSASRRDRWQVVLYQNTPAQLHGGRTSPRA
jgi:uncharacterized protein (TIGR02246 family)